MNILTTVFLRYDNEKIYYPNSVLITKPISNFYRSPEMSDAISFTIDISTPVDTIIAMKKAIQTYIYNSLFIYFSAKHGLIKVFVMMAGTLRASQSTGVLSTL